MNIDRLDHKIEEIERELLRDDAELGDLFAKLDPVDRQHDAIVFTLLAASAVFLMIGLSTMSIAAWLAGAISIVTALTIDTQHEHLVRDARRSAELGLAPSSRVVEKRQSDATSLPPEPGERGRGVTNEVCGFDVAAVQSCFDRRTRPGDSGPH